MLDKEKTYEKWSKAGLLEGLDNNQKNWMDQILVNDRGFGEGEYQPLDEENENKMDFSFPLLPMSMKVSAQTLAGGGWQQSKKQKQKQDRLNKLRKLQGDEPNVVLPDDEFVSGLVSVQPLSSPRISQLFYMDFKYDHTLDQEIVPKKRNKKHKAIKRTKYKSKLKSYKNKNTNRVDKFKYILKNNNKKWMISRFLKKKL